MSANFGASGGTGVALFDGTWNYLASAPSFCASGVSAQS